MADLEGKHGVNLMSNSAISKSKTLHRTDDYKLVDFEVLPKEWQAVKLGDIASVRYGKAKPKTVGSVPIIGSGGVYAWV